MKGFNIEEYTEYFKTETIEIVRWDKIEFQSAQLMFSQEPLKTSAKTLLEHVKKLSIEEMKELDEQLSVKPGRGGIDRKYKFNEIINYIDAYVSYEDCMVSNYGDGGDLDQYTMDQNEARLGSWQYNDPYWLLWKHFLIDVLGVLEAWAFINSKVGQEYEEEMENTALELINSIWNEKMK